MKKKRQAHHLNVNTKQGVPSIIKDLSIMNVFILWLREHLYHCIIVSSGDKLYTPVDKMQNLEYKSDRCTFRSEDHNSSLLLLMLTAGVPGGVEGGVAGVSGGSSSPFLLRLGGGVGG